MRQNISPKQLKAKQGLILTPKQKKELAEIYKDFFVPENQFKVDSGEITPFKIS